MYVASGMTIGLGSMYAGKSEFLTRKFERLVRLGYKEAEIQAFHHCLDTRYGRNKIISHSGLSIDSVPVQTSMDLEQMVRETTKIVIVDETQFFDHTIPDVLFRLAYNSDSNGTLTGKREVICAFIDKDFTGEPFPLQWYGDITALKSIANSIEHFSADCRHTDENGVCGEPAYFSQRLVNGAPAKYSDPVILVGAEESYIAVCGLHHRVPEKKEHYAVLNMLRVINDYNKSLNNKEGVLLEDIKNIDKILITYENHLENKLKKLLYSSQSIKNKPDSQDNAQDVIKQIQQYRYAEAALVNFMKYDRPLLGDIEDTQSRIDVLHKRRKIAIVNSTMVPL